MVDFAACNAPSQTSRATGRDFLLAAALLAVAILTFPFAFECGAILMIAFGRLRESLARVRYVWDAAVVAVMAIMLISPDVMSLVLHHNIFALFSSEKFLASRQASSIELAALLLSFCCLLLLSRLAALYRSQLPRPQLRRFRNIIAYLAAPFLLIIKWNHFVAPVAFLQHTTVGWAGFSVIDPDPKTLLMAPILAVVTWAAGSILILAIQALKNSWTRRAEGVG